MDKPVAELRRLEVAKRRLYEVMLDALVNQEMMNLLIDAGLSPEKFADLLLWAGSPMNLETVENTEPD